MDLRWSTGNTLSIQPGDRAFLLKQGGGKRGIFGRRATPPAPSSPGHHWDVARAARGDAASYVRCRFDLLLHPEDQEILSTEELRDRLPQVYWTPPASGTSVPANAEEMLETMWRRHRDGRALEGARAART